MKHHLSDQHRLPPIRVKLAIALIRSTGLIEHAHLLPPRRATLQELELVHSRRYIDLVRRLSDPNRRDEASAEDVDEVGFGSADHPISHELHQGGALLARAPRVRAPAIEKRTPLDHC